MWITLKLDGYTFTYLFIHSACVEIEKNHNLYS